MASAMWQVLFFGRPWPGVEFNEKLLSEIFFDEDDWEIAEERGAERLQEINFQTPHEALYKGVILKETMYEVIWKSDRGRGFFLQGPKSRHIAVAVPLYPKIIDVDFQKWTPKKPEKVEVLGMTAVDREVMICELRSLDEPMVDLLAAWRRELKDVLGLTPAEQQAVKFVTTERQCVLTGSNDLRYWCMMDGLPVPPALPAAGPALSKPKSKAKAAGPARKPAAKKVKKETKPKFKKVEAKQKMKRPSNKK